MAESVSSDGPRGSFEQRKYHESWIYHQPANGKKWSKYWMVLRGHIIFIFENEKTASGKMTGTLTLGPEAELLSATSDKKKGFKFELATNNRNGERKINKFKFDKENERDLWKSFIIGITVGIVPSDVHLLPGQLKCVHEAIDEIRNKPPPPPQSRTSVDIPRPKVTIQHNANTSFVPTNNFSTSDLPISPDRSDRSDAASSGSGSFRSHFTMHNKRHNSVPEVHEVSTFMRPPAPPSESGTTVRNLRELRQRQESLTSIILSDGSSATKEERQPRKWQPEMPPLSRAPPPPSMPPPSMPSLSPQTSHPPAFPHEVHHSDTVSMDSGFSHDANETHVFSLDHDRNKEIPSWFFDDCERDDAETLLTVGRQFGNVLIRPSSTFNITGKYVISMRREVAGGTNLNHYEVIKTHDGLKINVDNKHLPMRSLCEVMDFFVSVAGPGTRPMRTNDRQQLIQGTMRVSSSASSSSIAPVSPPPPAQAPPSFIPVPPPMPPPAPILAPPPPPPPPGPATPSSPADNWSFGKPTMGESTQRGGGGSTQQWPRSNGAPSPKSTTGWRQEPVIQEDFSAGGGWGTTNQTDTNQLRVQGNVSGSIAQAVSEMSESLPRQPYQGQYEEEEYINVPTHQRMPPRAAPAQRQPQGYMDDITNGFRNANIDTNPAPPPPPGLPPGGRPLMPRQPPTSTSTWANSQSAAPQPPSLPFHTMAQPAQRYDPRPDYGREEPPQMDMGNSGDIGGSSSFENELKGRLVHQRENIYATGATVHRNY